MEPEAPVTRLYFDEDVDVRLAEALRRRHYDVETAATAGLLEASDEEQLAYAAGQGRVLITHNIKHFPALHAAWVLGGRKHYGIVVLVGHSDLSAWVRRMESLSGRFTADKAHRAAA
jgi:hypothetical protein